MKKKEIKIPIFLDNYIIKNFLESRTGIVLSNWLNQGIRYMNSFERLYRMVTEIFVIFILFLFLSRLIHYSIAIAISVLIVHTLFWLFNGHFFVLMRYISNRPNDPSRFIYYIKCLNERVRKKKFLLAAAGFGSLSKGKFSSSSDFDLRLMRKKGIINSILAFNYAALERAKAFLSAFPLDIYVFDLEEIKYKIRSDEPPIILYDPEGALSKNVKNRIDFIEFSQSFERKYIHSDGKA